MKKQHEPYIYTCMISQVHTSKFLLYILTVTCSYKLYIQHPKNKKIYLKFIFIIFRNKLILSIFISIQSIYALIIYKHFILYMHSITINQHRFFNAIYIYYFFSFFLSTCSFGKERQKCLGINCRTYSSITGIVYVPSFTPSHCLNIFQVCCMHVLIKFMALFFLFCGGEKTKYWL